MLGLLPALWCLVGSLCVEGLDEGICDGRPNIGESPRDALIVADDHVGHSGQRHSGHIGTAALVETALKMRFVPQVRHLVPEMHIV